MNEIIQNVSFCVWFLSLSICPLDTFVVLHGTTVHLFSLLLSILLYGHNIFIQYTAGGYLSCFQLSITIYKTAVYIFVHFVCSCLGRYLGVDLLANGWAMYVFNFGR